MGQNEGIKHTVKFFIFGIKSSKFKDNLEDSVRVSFQDDIISWRQAVKTLRKLWVEE